MPPKPSKIELRLTEDTETEVSKEFLQGMVNRMIVSFHKYGPVADAYPDKVNALESMQQRVEEYRRTGNTEFLIDAGNFVMIEFMRPSHPQAYFQGTDSEQSPGRTTADGTVTTASNADI